MTQKYTENKETSNKFRVNNYRYGLPKGTMVEEDMIDVDRKRFLTPIVEKVSKAKRGEE